MSNEPTTDVPETNDTAALPERKMTPTEFIWMAMIICAVVILAVLGLLVFSYFTVGHLA